MFKRRQETRFGSQTSPRPRTSDIAGCRVGSFNKKIDKLMEEHSAKVELEVKKALETMKLKATHNSIAPPKKRRHSSHKLYAD